MFSNKDWNNFFKSFEDYEKTKNFSPNPIFLDFILSKSEIKIFSATQIELLNDPWIFFEFCNRDNEIITREIRMQGSWRNTMKILNTRTNPLKIRRFRDDGSYPDQVIQGDDFIYGVVKCEPLLITASYGKKNTDDFYSSYGFWATPLELKVLLGMSMPVHTSYLPYLSYSSVIERIPQKVLLNENEQLSIKTLEKSDEILKMFDVFPKWNDPHYSEIKRNFKFAHDYKNEKAIKFIEGFDSENNMQLSVSSLLLRAANHHARREEVFDEEALVNIVFAMEAIYNLYHAKYLANTPFNKKEVKNKIKELFPEFPGFDYVVDDAWEKRIKISHPHKLDGDEWRIDIMPDDFMDSYLMALELLYFLVTGEKLGWH